MKAKVVCLFSGGMDSSTCLAYALQEGYEAYALTVDYGQLHKKELECAKKLTAKWQIPHECIQVPFPWKGSSLLSRAHEIPKGRQPAAMQDIPSTYVPARNSVLLSLGTSYAEAVGAEALFIGVNALDYSGYPDCRPEFIKAFEAAMRLGTRTGTLSSGIQIQAPLQYKTKKDIVQLGKELGVPFEMTWTCYEGGERPCGSCDACILRQRGFEEAGMKDPLK